MIHASLLWLLVAAFLGAGLFNAMSMPATQRDFARWGYPRWWGRLTGGLELVSALLIALPATRIAGLALGASIVAAAAWTVVRRHEFAHLMPLGAFATLIALVTLPA